MNDDSQASKPDGRKDDPLPPTGEVVLVQADGFRCLAFRDKDGKWRGAFHQEELLGDVRVINSN
jgi:hypothetical protein